MPTLDEILAKVIEQDTRLDSVRELIIGLRQQVKDLLAQIGGISPENQAKIDAIFVQAQKNSAEIEEAIAENTPPTDDTTPPSVPDGLATTTFSDTEINLIWNPSTDDVGVQGYRVSRDGVVVGTVSLPAFSDTGLSASTAYSYTVSSFDAKGNESAQSAAVSATTNA